MWRRIRELKPSSTVAEWMISGTVVGIVVGLALSGVWVFRATTNATRASSVWAELLADRMTLGVIRLLLIAAAVYALTSIAVHVSRRRWVRAISTTGIEVDAASASHDVIATLRRDLQRALAERDEARRLAWRLARG